MSIIDDIMDIPGEIFGSKKSSKTVAPEGQPLGTVTDPKVIANQLYGADNTNIIQSKATLSHGGEVEIIKGHDYIKDLIK